MRRDVRATCSLHKAGEKSCKRKTDMEVMVCGRNGDAVDRNRKRRIIREMCGGVGDWMMDWMRAVVY